MSKKPTGKKRTIPKKPVGAGARRLSDNSPKKIRNVILPTQSKVPPLKSTLKSSGRKNKSVQKTVTPEPLQDNSNDIEELEVAATEKPLRETLRESSVEELDSGDEKYRTESAAESTDDSAKRHFHPATSSGQAYKTSDELSSSSDDDNSSETLKSPVNQNQRGSVSPDLSIPVLNAVRAEVGGELTNCATDVPTCVMLFMVMLPSLHEPNTKTKKGNFGLCITSYLPTDEMENHFLSTVIENAAKGKITRVTIDEISPYAITSWTAVKAGFCMQTHTGGPVLIPNSPDDKLPSTMLLAINREPPPEAKQSTANKKFALQTQIKYSEALNVASVVGHNARMPNHPLQAKAINCLNMCIGGMDLADLHSDLLTQAEWIAECKNMHKTPPVVSDGSSESEEDETAEDAAPVLDSDSKYSRELINKLCRVYYHQKDGSDIKMIAVFTNLCRTMTEDEGQRRIDDFLVETIKQMTMQNPSKTVLPSCLICTDFAITPSQILAAGVNVGTFTYMTAGGNHGLLGRQRALQQKQSLQNAANLKSLSGEVYALGLVDHFHKLVNASPGDTLEAKKGNAIRQMNARNDQFPVWQSLSTEDKLAIPTVAWVCPLNIACIVVCLIRVCTYTGRCDPCGRA